MMTIFDIYESIMDRKNRQTVGSNVMDTIKGEVDEFIQKNYITNHCTYDVLIKDDKVLVDVYGDISTRANLDYLTNGKFKFNHIQGSFFIRYCDELKSLEGGPDIVDENYSYAYGRVIKDLEGAPHTVGRAFICSDCRSLVSLKGSPKKCMHFNVTYCPNLKSLKYGPKEVTKNYIVYETGNDGKETVFTDEDVRKYTKVGGKIIKFCGEI